MELVEVTLTPVQRRAGAAWVPWRELAAQQRRRGAQVRVLAPGDDVMVKVDDGTIHRGWVLRNASAAGEGAYVIMFGTTLARRLPVGTERRPEPVVQDVEVRVVPAQRRSVSLDL